MTETTVKAEATPGPWYVGAQNDVLFIIDKPPRPSNDYPRDDFYVAAIAKVYHNGQWGTEDANASLLAAAPDLLAALKEVRRWLVVEGGYLEIAPVIRACDVAIEKAASRP